MFVDRNKQGNITGVYARKQKRGQKSIAADDSELLAFQNPIPEYVRLRKQAISEGGYGTVDDQLEIIGEQGVAAFKTHVAAVKARFPG